MLPVAQSVERRSSKPRVVGSNPTRSELFEVRSSTLKPAVKHSYDIIKGELLPFDRTKAGITRPPS